MPSPTNKAQDNSIRENVYRVIRENITSLQLAPGTTVSTQELAAKLQVSRTPVREAVFQPSAKLVLCRGRFRNIVHLFSCFCLLSLLSIFIIFAPRLKLKT